MIWAVIFPQSGDGDAIMHYLNAHDSLWQPIKLTGSWARAGAKLPLLIPAQFGILGARWMSALISVLCAWQTIRLAEDLKMSRAVLAAPLLIFQPFVFALAGDTMTELPFALGLVVAIRLWWADRILLSCLVIGYLPTVRPEGFFICALWALLVIAKKRWEILPVLGWGTAALFVGCWILRHDPTYFFREGWSWPADSVRVYGHGSFFAHVNRWPVYCGPVLFVAFLAGIFNALPFGSRLNNVGIALVVLELSVPSPIRENLLPWAGLVFAGAIAWAVRKRKFAIGVWVFLLIFFLHSVLWWRGWFGSCGLMRILACVSPITAVICLRGWNVIADRLPRYAEAVGISLVAVTAMAYYVVEPMHYRIFPLQRACEFVAENHLLSGAPMIIFGDPMAQAALHMPPNPPNLMPHNCDRFLECNHLLHAPIGSVGLWDNQHAQAWFDVSLSDLEGLGYTALFKTDARPPFAIEWLEPANTPRDQIYVVIRKDRVGKLPF